MFKDRTLFIIGAGASAEVGMPVGKKLSETIRENSLFKFEGSDQPTRGSYDLLRCLKQKHQTHEEINFRLSAFRQLHDGIYLSSSIDNYIDMHFDNPHIAEVGKLSIVDAISSAEQKSNLFVDLRESDPKIDLSQAGVSDSWLDSFARILLEKSQKDLGKISENVSIICFNYDRCIEYYLTDAISQTLSIEYSTAREVVENMNIIHPYGTLGQLPKSRGHIHGDQTVGFGFDLSEGLNPWPVVEKIKTYTEQIEDLETLERMRASVEEADQIVFLGFAFHPQNMELLTLHHPTPPKRVYATGMGVSRQETDEVTRRIVDLYRGESSSSISSFEYDQTDDLYERYVVIENDVECRDLFKLHWRNLLSA